MNPSPLFRNRFLLVLIPALWFASAACGLGAGPDRNTFSPSSIDAGSDYLRLLNRAADYFGRGKFPQAVKLLDEADKIKPDLPDALNMRGAILLDEGKFPEAQEMFERSLAAEPGSFWPRFNLAEIKFLQKDYKGASEALAKMKESGSLAEIIDFKNVEIALLQKDFGSAKIWLDKLNFSGETPAYYFSQAAWAYAHQEERNGNGWMASGVRIFGAERTRFFADSLVDAGWISKNKVQ